MTQQLTLQQITHQQGFIIDTRCMAFYNGWPMAPGGMSGHEPGAHPANWLSRLDRRRHSGMGLRAGVTADTPIAFYGVPQDCDAVRLRFGALGFNANAILTDALTDPSRLVSLPGFHQRVSVAWLNQLLQGQLLRRNRQARGGLLKSQPARKISLFPVRRIGHSAARILHYGTWCRLTACVVLAEKVCG
jgi:hypothetical protein